MNVTQRKLMITHHTDAREEHSACMGSLHAKVKGLLDEAILENLVGW